MATSIDAFVVQTAGNNPLPLLVRIGRANMKLQLLSLFVGKRTISAVLLILATAPLGHGMTSRHVRHRAALQGTRIKVQYLVPQKEKANGSYQPPRSPGYNEDFGS